MSLAVQRPDPSHMPLRAAVEDSTPLLSLDRRLSTVAREQFRAFEFVWNMIQIIKSSIWGSGVALILWGCWYFIPVNNEAAKSIRAANSVAVKVILNLGNTISVVGLSTWALGKTLNEIFDRAPQKRRYVPLSYVGAIPVGLASQGAVAYVAYISNGYKILPALVLFAADSPLPIYSTAKSFQKIFQRVCGPKKSDVERYFDSVRENLLKELDASREGFLRMPRESQKTFVEELFGFIDQGNMIAILGKLYAHHFVEEESPSCCDWTLQKVVSGFGAVSLATHQALVARIGYIAGEHFSNGNLVAGVVTGAVVGCASLYVSGKSVMNSSLELYSRARDHLRGRYVAPITEQLRPGLAKTLFCTRVVVSSLSWGASVGMVDKAFDSGPFRETMEVFASASWALLVLNAMRDLSDSFIHWRISKSEDEKERSIMGMDYFYQQHRKNLEEASYQDLAHYVLDLPEDVLSKVGHSTAKEYAQRYLRPPSEQEPV